MTSPSVVVALVLAAIVDAVLASRVAASSVPIPEVPVARSSVMFITVTSALVVAMVAISMVPSRSEKPQQVMPGWVKLVLVTAFALTVAVSLALNSNNILIASALPKVWKAFWFSIFTNLLASCGKLVCMKWLGFTWEEIRVFLSCQTYDLNKWCDNYGDARIMRCDGFFRKVSHIGLGIFHLVVWHSCGAAEGDLQAALQYDLVHMIGPVFLWNVFAMVSIDWLPVNMAWASVLRVRDGKERRLNVIVVNAVSQLTSFILHVFLIRVLFEGGFFAESERFIVQELMYFPLFVGDGFAEVIGVFGTHRFPVPGIGEINNKSVEGCIGFVVTNMVASLTSCYIHGVGPAWYVLGVLISIVGMLVETFTPRGFDNATIPFTSIAFMFGFSLMGFRGS